MAVVVDTDVVSYFLKNDTRKLAYEEHLDGQFLFMSFMTVAELELWALSANWGPRKRTQLDEYLKRFSIVHSKSEICVIWAQIMDSARRSGNVIATSDAWVAAAAVFLEIPLVTNNKADFEKVGGLTILSEA